MTDQQPFPIISSRFAAGGSRTGPRHRDNEDSLRIVVPDDESVRLSHGDLYLVADGVGGHAGGEIASALAVEAVEAAYFAGRHDDAAANLVAAVEAANLRILESSRDEEGERLGMATTIVAAAVLPDQIVIANVGDSRAYLIGDGAIRQLSHDHSWVQDQVESGKLTAEEARQSPRRNMITRALGLTASVETDVRTEKEAPADTRLVLCSDGVHGLFGDAELAALISGADPRTAAERVLTAVDRQQGHDDATIVVVDIGGISGGQPVEDAAPRDAFLPRVFRLFRRG